MNVTLFKPGRVFGRLKVVSGPYFPPNGRSVHKCICRCGKVKMILTNSLKRGSTISCGCYGRDHPPSMEQARLANITHGMTKTAAYRIWGAMKRRCFGKTSVGYKHWGGRGITVCKRWMKFANFFKDMGARPSGMSLGRINNDGHYCKSNCRWETRSQQNNNTRVNRTITYLGQRKTVTEAARIAGLKVGTLTGRLDAGWSVNMAMTAPLGVGGCRPHKEIVVDSGASCPLMGQTTAHPMAHVRIGSHAAAVINSLIQQNGLYPAHAGRSIAETVNTLLLQSPDFKTAERQMNSEKHPRPAGAKR